jgi:hypothetical protein
MTLIWAMIFGSGPKSTGNKSKNRQIGLYQNKKLLQSKGNNPTEGKDGLHNRRIYLQILYLTRY